MRRLIISVIALLLLPMALFSRNIRIKGLVLDESGNAAIGAAVMVLGTDKGTVVDAAGKFSIEADSYATLVVSCLGYVEQRIPVEARQDIKVILVPDNKVLDETVVIGYGTAKKKDLTGAVAVVEMDKLQSAALMNVDEALAGRIAGVEVISSGGQPGESSNIRIRGSRSINAPYAYDSYSRGFRCHLRTSSGLCNAFPGFGYDSHFPSYIFESQMVCADFRGH